MGIVNRCSVCGSNRFKDLSKPCTTCTKAAKVVHPTVAAVQTPNHAMPAVGSMVLVTVRDGTVRCFTVQSITDHKVWVIGKEGSHPFRIFPVSHPLCQWSSIV